MLAAAVADLTVSIFTRTKRRTELEILRLLCCGARRWWPLQSVPGLAGQHNTAQHKHCRHSPAEHTCPGPRASRVSPAVTVPWCSHLTHRRHCNTEQLIIAAQQTLQQRAGTLEAEDRQNPELRWSCLQDETQRRSYLIEM